MRLNLLAHYGNRALKMSSRICFTWWDLVSTGKSVDNHKQQNSNLKIEYQLTMLITATDFCYAHIHAVFMEMAPLCGKETASYCRFAYLHSEFSLVTLSLAGILFSITQLFYYLRYVEVWCVKGSTGQLRLGGLRGYTRMAVWMALHPPPLTTVLLNHTLSGKATSHIRHKD